MKSFIVDLWSQIFYGLEKISLFWVVRKLIPATRESYRFVDWWVLGHLLLSFVLLAICSALNLHWGEAIAVGWGVIRVFEVIIYQINVVLFGEYRAKKAGKPYAFRGFRRIVILLLHNYAEIIFWFALFYHHWDWAFEAGRVALDSFLGALNFSFATMTSFGYTTIAPKETLGDVLTLIQSVIGLFMVLLILARFLSLLPKPKTLDEFEK